MRHQTLVAVCCLLVVKLGVLAAPVKESRLDGLMQLLRQKEGKRSMGGGGGGGGPPCGDSCGPPGGGSGGPPAGMGGPSQVREILAKCEAGETPPIDVQVDVCALVERLASLMDAHEHPCKGLVADPGNPTDEEKQACAETMVAQIRQGIENAEQAGPAANGPMLERVFGHLQTLATMIMQRKEEMQGTGEAPARRELLNMLKKILQD